MHEHDVVIAALLDEVGLTLDEFARACAVERDWVEARVREGLIGAQGDAPQTWRFTSVHLRRARKMQWLEREFDAVPELAAMVVDLIEELDALRAQMR